MLLRRFNTIPVAYMARDDSANPTASRDDKIRVNVLESIIEFSFIKLLN